MRVFRFASLVLLTLTIGACRKSAPALMEASTSADPPQGTAKEVALPAGATTCGAMGCISFANAVDAFRFVLAHEPRVLAVGEAHAQKGTEGIASSTKRFTEELLPEVAPRAAGMILELWLGEPKCGKVVEAVREQTKPVTSSQVKTNPNEMVALGDRAYALGVKPYPLRPSCEEYGPIADAGADAVPLMLDLIAKLSGERVRALLDVVDKNPDAGNRTLVLAYGGLLHNDLNPAPGKERFSFGPATSKATNGRYIELDVVVGDFVRDEAPWTSLPWLKTYLAEPKTDRTLLYRPSPGSFVLVYPKTR